MTRLYVIIPTYNRPDKLSDLLSDLREQSQGFDLNVHVYNDASTVPYPRESGVYYHTYDRNHGKRMFWRLISDSFRNARLSEWDHLLMIQDDVRLKKEALKSLVSQWETLSYHDRQAACLNPLLDGRTKCWTRYDRRNIHYGTHSYWLAQWVDGMYICSRPMMEALRWKLTPIDPDRWEKWPRLSSGVGQQITIRLVQRGFRLYQVKKSLLIHENHESVMNPPDTVNNRPVSL